jgi:hypothetical protein
MLLFPSEAFAEVDACQRVVGFSDSTIHRPPRRRASTQLLEGLPPTPEAEDDGDGVEQ